MKTSKILITLFVTTIAGLCITSCEKENYQPAAPVQADESPAQTNSVNQNGMGCLMLPTSAYDKLQKAPLPIGTQTFPTTYSLPCPQIKSQGSEGSCVAWATAYAARSIVERMKSGSGGTFSNSTNVFSPEFVYNQIKLSWDCGSGAHVPDALDLLTSAGVCTWNAMPYTDADCTTLPNAAQREDASHHGILIYGTVSISVSAIKAQLYAGNPVIVCGPVDRNFYSNSGGIINSFSPIVWDYVGEHCYTIVGWDANKNAFKVMNSWGTDWKNSGFGWVHFSVINDFFKEAYVMFSL